jgi:hypothetical protein
MGYLPDKYCGKSFQFETDIEHRIPEEDVLAEL